MDAVGRFERALSLSDECLGAGEYEAAYHALMSALHLATTLGDEALLTRVAEAAAAQGRVVDALKPVHRLSTQEAQSRGHESVFQLAVRQASAHASMARRKQHGDHPTPALPEAPPQTE